MSQIQKLKDSGKRMEFDTGAVRDMYVGKGRCDLMPIDILAKILLDDNLLELDQFMKTGDRAFILSVLHRFAMQVWGNEETMFLETSVHFEDGAVKYGLRNWEKGIVCSSYVNSAIRHYLKFKRGDDDERHDRAFCWNLMCLYWTLEHKPEVNDLPFEQKKETA